MKVSVTDERGRSAAVVETIPGVGPSIGRDLRELGYPCVGDLEGVDPERLYDDLCELQGARIDRCVLYVFRCAEYYANTEEHDPELLKWWNWKDTPGRRLRPPS